MGIVTYDLGEVFAGRKSGKTINGWDKPQPFTPPRDDGYLWPAWIVDVLTTLRLDDPLYIYGPTGCGKSQGVRQVAACLNWPVYEVTGHSRLEFPELAGGFHVKDGNMVWHDGPLTAALRGGGVLLINEMDLLAPETAAGLNSILDGSPLFVPELNEYIPRHPEFRFIATGNSNGSGDATGLYQGVLRQNIALMSRFTTVQATYLSPDEEMQILRAKLPNLPKGIGQTMIKIANEIRKAFVGNTESDTRDRVSVTMSPRDLLRWGKLALAFQPLAEQGEDVLAYSFDRAFAFRADAPTRVTLHAIKQRVAPFKAPRKNTVNPTTLDTITGVASN